MSALGIIERIEQADREVDAARLNRDEAYRAFATFVRQSMKRNGVKRQTIRNYMGWKEHTLGNVLNQGDRLTSAEMVKLADVVTQEGRAK